MLKNKHKKDNMSVIDGDILELSINRINSDNNGATVIIPHVCNNINLFGSGFAGYIAKNYPIVKQNFHLLGNQAKLGHVQYVKIGNNITYRHELIIGNMIAQNQIINQSNPRPINYEALVRCMINIRNYILELNKNDIDVEIHCPKFGSGLAGGNWNFISDLIEDIWKNQRVFIYNYNRKADNDQNRSS